jgi:RimJ/RimL family protein N-acetyltransferase
MEFLPAILNRAETETMIETIVKRLSQQGFGFWATELKGSKAFIGFIGLNVPGYPLPFSPCTEIGWRLAFDYWGNAGGTVETWAGQINPWAETIAFRLN